MNADKSASEMGRILARAWDDAEFKKRLLADATAALRQEGLDLPDGLTVKAVENTEAVIHLVLPAKPSPEMSDQDLGGLSGGTARCILRG